MRCSHALRQWDAPERLNHRMESRHDAAPHPADELRGYGQSGKGSAGRVVGLDEADWQMQQKHSLKLYDVRYRMLPESAFYALRTTHRVVLTFTFLGH